MRRITKLGPWLRPALLAPWLSMAAYVSVGVLLGHHDPLLGGPLANWVIAMLFGTAWAGAISAALLGVDTVRVRRGVPVPEGAPAWLGGALAFGLCLGSYWVFRPGRFDGLLFWIALVAPVISSAVGARTLTWRRGRD